MTHFDSDHPGERTQSIQVVASVLADGFVLINMNGRERRFTPARARLFGQAVIDTADAVEATATAAAEATATAVLVDGLKALLANSTIGEMKAALAVVTAEEDAAAVPDLLDCCKHCVSDCRLMSSRHTLRCGERYPCGLKATR